MIKWGGSFASIAGPILSSITSRLTNSLAHRGETRGHKKEGITTRIPIVFHSIIEPATYTLSSRNRYRAASNIQAPFILSSLSAPMVLHGPSIAARRISCLLRRYIDPSRSVCYFLLAFRGRRGTVRGFQSHGSSSPCFCALCSPFIEGGKESSNWIARFFKVTDDFGMMRRVTS